MTDQLIFRQRVDDNYTVLRNDLLQDENLTWEARGMLCYLLSQKKEWVVRMKDLERSSPAGETVVKRVLHELEEKRYIKRKKERNDKGRFEWITWVFDEPYPTTPPKTTDGSSTDGKPPDIESTNTESNTTNEWTDKQWSAYLRKGGPKRDKNEDPLKAPDNKLDLSWLEEPLHDYAREFIKVFKRGPVGKNEKEQWATAFREWQALHIPPNKVKVMWRFHQEEGGKVVKSPFSIKYAWENIRTTHTTHRVPKETL